MSNFKFHSKINFPGNLNTRKGQKEFFDRNMVEECVVSESVDYSSKPTGHYMYRQLTLNNSTFCPHSVFMYFVWISEQTAIISLYSINWLVCVTETECLLRGTDGVFIYN
jgi:hypothetical protein